MTDKDNKLYLEDFKEGEEMISMGRTITESDVVMFAGITGDWNPLHTDEEFARTTVFGKRIAHGALGFIVHSGLFTRIDRIQRSATVAVLGFNEWRYTRPIFIGDTLRLKLKVISIRESATKKDRGVLTLKRELINQKDEVVQEGTSDTLVLRRLS